MGHGEVLFINPYAAGGWFGQYKIMKNKLKNDWNPGKWVLIWEYSIRAFIWVPTRLGSDDFQDYLLFCALDESNLSSKRVNQLCASCKYTDQ